MPNDDRPIYLDHNATTPLLPEVVDAMLPFLATEFGNPSSSHPWGRRARQAVDAARARVATLIGCTPEEILFTSGGTEANNLAIRGVAEAMKDRAHCISSVIEHPATTNPCRDLERRGWRVDWAEVDGDARVRLGRLIERITEGTALVTVMHSNNETGTMQPIREITAAAHEHGVLVHTDAAQSVGKVRVDVRELGVDLLTIAGHKLNAPKGIGALFVRSGTPLRPLLLGASHERGLRPGTENVASIVGLGVACELAGSTIDTKSARLAELRDRLLSKLKAAIPNLGVNGEGADRLPNTASLRFPSVRGSELLDMAPRIAASTGSACHAGHETPSSVLVAMGVAPEEALQTVRLSVGTTTSIDEVDEAAAILTSAWSALAGHA